MALLIVGALVLAAYIVYLGVLSGGDPSDWMQRRAIANQFRRFFAGAVAVVAIISALLLIGLLWAPVLRLAELVARFALASVAIFAVLFVGVGVYQYLMGRRRT